MFLSGSVTLCVAKNQPNNRLHLIHFVFLHLEKMSSLPTCSKLDAVSQSPKKALIVQMRLILIPFHWHSTVIIIGLFNKLFFPKIPLQCVLYSAIWMDRIVRMDRMNDDEHLFEVQDKNAHLHLVACRLWQSINPSLVFPRRKRILASPHKLIRRHNKKDYIFKVK